jgi:hypothetical protein
MIFINTFFYQLAQKDILGQIVKIVKDFKKKCVSKDPKVSSEHKKINSVSLSRYLKENSRTERG